MSLASGPRWTSSSQTYASMSFSRTASRRIGIDLSGESLHRRGYREEGGRAPLKENLAAAVLTRAQIRKDAPLVDLMCGSATLLIEGASMLADIAPGLGREFYGFVRWRGHDTPTWDALVAEARERREEGLKSLPPIVGYEPDTRTVNLARDNIRNAGLDKHITIEKASLASITHELPPGVIVTNPPYGVRLSDDEGRALTKLYEELGTTLKSKFAGWRASVLVPQGELAGSLRLRGDKRYSFFNGAIPCWLFIYGLSETVRTVAKTSEGETAFANRLRKNVITFGKWAKHTNVECYRLYDGDIPEYALAVDRYGKYIHVQEYQAPKTIDERVAARRMREALHALPEALGVDERNVFVKVRKQQKGTQQYEKQDERGDFLAVQENGHTFWVNFTDYLDTGLFLDHRDTRKLVGEMSAGKRVLNLFAYTCTATVYAAKGGAVSTTSVDASHTYLDWAERNFRSNGLTRSDHHLVQDDVIGWLAESRDVFDLIFVDPPTFSNSKDRDDFDVQRDHISLLSDCAKLLSPDGVIIFSNNFRRFKLDTELLSRAGMVAEDITAKTIPKDFERNARIHKCFIIRRSG